MKKSILVLVCLLPFSLLAQKKSRLESISVAYPISWDFSVQDPDDGKKFRNLGAVFSAFDVQAVIARPGKMTLARGRYTYETTGAYGPPFFESGSMLHRGSYLYLKIGLGYRFLEKGNQ